jgi:YggT family protein
VLILANFVHGLAEVLSMLLWLYQYVLIGRVIISWVNADPYNSIVRAIVSVTEPVLYRIRRYLPVVYEGIDFSPIVAFALLLFLNSFLVRSLADLAVYLGWRPAGF